MQIATSSWTFHPFLGRPPITGPRDPALSDNPALLERLLAWIDALPALGVTAIDLCHFHVPSRAPTTLAAIRERLALRQVRLNSLLIDAGNLSGETHAQEDLCWTADWLPVAAALGAAQCRIAGGDAPPAPENVERLASALGRLIAHAKPLGVGLVLENWRTTLHRPAPIEGLLARFPSLGFCLDLGNLDAHERDADLARLAPRATCAHIKAAELPDGSIDEHRLAADLAVLRAAGFSGPAAIIGAESLLEVSPQFRRVRALLAA